MGGLEELYHKQHGAPTQKAPSSLKNKRPGDLLGARRFLGLRCLLGIRLQIVQVKGVDKVAESRQVFTLHLALILFRRDAGLFHDLFRDKDGQISEETRSALKAELGDVLWYVAQVCTELDLSFDDVAEYNIAKLYDRLERGKIRGDGDDR